MTVHVFHVRRGPNFRGHWWLCDEKGQQLLRVTAHTLDPALTRWKELRGEITKIERHYGWVLPSEAEHKIAQLAEGPT